MTNAWRFNLTEDRIDCINQHTVDWDNPLALISEQLERHCLFETQREKGADRQQIWFEFDCRTYVIMCEVLCDAIWIEPLNQTDSTNLPALFKLLNS